MDAINNNYSAIVNIEKHIIQDMMNSRYFTASVLVVVMYDAILTIEDEVSEIMTRLLELHSFFGGPLGLARGFLSSEATLLHQPVLHDCDPDSCQLPWVTSGQDTLRR